MDGVQERLQRLQQGLEQARALKSRAEGRREQLEAERQQILQELQQEGVTPEELDATIERLRQELADKLAEAEQLVPWDLVGGDRSGYAG